jgi:outer membrane receptor protein involved in Fe transport
MPAYALADLQAGVDFKVVQFSLFARNIFDKAAQVSADTGLVPLGGPVLVTEQRPRTIGVTMTAPF